MALLLELFRHFLRNLSNSPGIYQMLDAKGKILYVGKARNLKKRVTSYFTGHHSVKTQALLRKAYHIETIVTHTETEALILENNLIKKHQPRYNILLRDDKGYPYIVLSEHADYPRLQYYRGQRSGNRRYFGPYPNGFAVRVTLKLLQKIFRTRTCQDSFFQTRTRPCLQYQIKNCSAPCVGIIDLKNYQQDVQSAVLFLQGKSQETINHLVQQMQQAVEDLNYEKAARLRDQISSLRQIHQQQAVSFDHRKDIDIIALALSQNGDPCVQVVTFREGELINSQSFFPTAPAQSPEGEILSAFIPQYYLANELKQSIPALIYTSHRIMEPEWIANTLSEHAGYPIKLKFSQRKDTDQWVQLGIKNAEYALSTQQAKLSTIENRLDSLRQALKLTKPIENIECFDISHMQGEATVASCVVYNQSGLARSEYRRFNIREVKAGDDYAAMHQVLTRRYKRLKEDQVKLPDLIIVDGGKGQLQQAAEVISQLEILSLVSIIGIAKGEGRKPGLETIFMFGKSEPISLSFDSPALHLLQEIRDEAHRFAITFHRDKRTKKRSTSLLEGIPGIGAKRRRELLRQFGGLQELKRANIEEIEKLPGFNRKLSARIYGELQKI